MPQPTPAERIAQRKRAIFAACKANGVDDDARRLIVKNITGCSSMADCTLLQLGEVLDHLNRGKGGYAGRKRVTPSADRAPLLEKIDALLAAWLQPGPLSMPMVALAVIGLSTLGPRA